MKNLTLTTLLSTLIILTTAFTATANNPIDNKLPKPIAYNFTGYCVQVLEVDKELTTEHTIFESFGDVKIEREVNAVYYLVGEFKTEKAANEYMNKVITSRYPNAIIARYRDGVRIDLEE